MTAINYKDLQNKYNEIRDEYQARGLSGFMSWEEVEAEVTANKQQNPAIVYDWVYSNILRMQAALND